MQDNDFTRVRCQKIYYALIDDVTLVPYKIELTLNAHCDNIFNNG